MTVKAEDAKAVLVDKAAAQVRATAPSEEAPEIEAFLRRYFADAALEDLGEIDLYGAALSHVAALFSAPDAFPTGRGVFSVRVTSVSFET